MNALTIGSRVSVTTICKSYPGLQAIPAGTLGTVTSVEHHGASPYTRYCIDLDNGGMAVGLSVDLDLTPIH